MRWILFYMLAFLSFTSMRAQKECNIWYFGNGAGIDFNYTPPIALVNSNMYTPEGCSSIADSNGNLLFYTDGSIVWDKNHDTMMNGDKLFGDVSSVHSAIIVRQPASNRYYYIFTTDAVNRIPNRGVCYSIVDMQADSGRGAVINTKKNVFLFSNSAEQISVVQHKNKKDIWLAGLQNKSDVINFYLLSKNGLSPPIKKKTGQTMISYYPNGQMKFSANGKKLAYSDINNKVIYLWDFDNINCVLSNKITINGVQSYGLEFSPNSKYLYFTKIFGNNNSFNKLFQCPLATIGQGLYSDTICKIISSGFYVAAMQLAPNGKIYFAKNGVTLGVIDFPDSTGITCGFKYNNLDLKGKSTVYGLPAFVQSNVYAPHIVHENICFLDSSKIHLINSYADSIHWYFGDGDKVNTTQNTIKHLYKYSGTFLITAITISDSGTNSDTFTKLIHISDTLKLQLGNDTLICKNDTLKLNVFSDSCSYLWQDNSSLPSFNVINSGIFWVQRTNKFGCRISDTIKIKSGPKFKVFIGNDTAFCHQFSHIIKASPGFKTYNWNTGSTAMQITVNSKGIYSVKVLDSNTCPSGDTIAIDQIQKPVIKLSYDSVNCQYVYLSTDSLKGLTYLWSNGETNKDIKVSKKGWISLTASHPFCSNKDSVYVNQLPMPEVDLGIDTSLCANELVLKTNEQGQYLWNTGGTRPSIVINQPGKYWLTVTRNNCSATDTINVKLCEDMLYYVPDVFSPNGDNINEVFRIYGSNIVHVEMEIFNRWGELLLKTSGKDAMWDGTYKEEPCMQSVYFYKVTLKGRKAGSVKNLKGSVLLLK